MKKIFILASATFLCGQLMAQSAAVAPASQTAKKSVATVAVVSTEKVKAAENVKVTVVEQAKPAESAKVAATEKATAVPVTADFVAAPAVVETPAKNEEMKAAPATAKPEVSTAKPTIVEN